MATRPFKFNLGQATTPVKLDEKKPKPKPQQNKPPQSTTPTPPPKQEKPKEDTPQTDKPKEKDTNTLTDPTTDVQTLANNAAKARFYDEAETYIGVVADVIAKGPDRQIFKIDGPLGQVQAYSNAIRAPFRSKMHIGASVEFAPIENPGAGGVTFYTAQIIGIRSSDPRVEILNDIQELYAGTVQTKTFNEVLAAVKPQSSLDDNVAGLGGHFKGELIGCTDNGLFCFTKK